MITINLTEARAIIREADSQVKAKPKLNISIVPSNLMASQASPRPSPEEREVETTKPRAIVKNELRERASGDFNKLRIEQAKLSNTIFDEVQRGASIAELATLYEKIEGFRPELIELYQRTRHVERHSKLPEEKKEAEPLADLFSLKDQKRKLISQRNKKSTLIKQWTAAGHKKLIEWQLELDKLNAEYNLVDEQIKKLSGK